MPRVKFGRPKERLRVASRDQGLRSDNKVRVKGNKRPSLAASLEAMEQGADVDDFGGLSAFPVNNFSGFGMDNKKKKTKKKHKGGKKKKKGRKGGLFDLGSSGGSDMEGSLPPPPPSPPSMHRRGTSSAPPHPSRTARSAPEVGFSDDSEGEGSWGEGSSLGSMSDFDFDEEGSLGGLSSFSSGSSRVGKRPSVPLDDSFSVVDGQSSQPKKSVDKNMFRGMSKQEGEEAEKNDLLARFHFLRQRGVHITKNYGPKSSLNEMRMEMGRIEHEQQMHRAIKINRRWFMLGASMLTNATDNYGPRLTRGRWHGFDKYLTTSIEDYDEPFERVSEHYGGIVGALTGGNPLYEIILLFGYQFLVYGFATNGAEQSRANESMSSDEIQRRYPNLIKEAVEVELNRRREDEESDLRRRQQEQRNSYTRFETGQHIGSQRPHHVSVNEQPTFIRPPPATDFSQYYTQQQQQQQQQQQHHQPMTPPPPLPPTLNSEGQHVAHEPQPMMVPPISHQSPNRMPQQAPAQVTFMVGEDPFLYSEMKSALDQIDSQVNQQPLSYVEVEDVTEATANGYLPGEEETHVAAADTIDNFDTPVATREGRPRELNTPPPNKRDKVGTPFGNDEQPAEDEGKFVININ